MNKKKRETMEKILKVIREEKVIDKQMDTARELDDYCDLVRKNKDWYYEHDIENKPAFINESFKMK
jgi:hypothetical protein